MPEIKIFHPLERLKKIAVGIGVLLTHHLLYESPSEHFPHDEYSEGNNISDWQKQNLQADIDRQLHEGN